MRFDSYSEQEWKEIIAEYEKHSQWIHQGLFLSAKIGLVPKEVQAPKNITQTGLSSAWTRATFIVNNDLNEKIKAVAYWDRLTVKEVLHEALLQYLKGR